MLKCGCEQPALLTKSLQTEYLAAGEGLVSVLGGGNSSHGKLSKAVSELPIMRICRSYKLAR